MRIRSIQWWQIQYDQLQALITCVLSALQQKNVGTTMLEGKVGRIYMPKQSFDTIGLSKMKGLKRERRQAAAAAATAAQDGGKKQRTAEAGE